MILQPAVVALLGASAASLAATGGAALFGAQVLRRWDLGSGARGQILLERRTYLVSTVLGIALAVQLAALLLFVFTADRLAVHFTGAMCAVGSLDASPYGWPLLAAKLLLAFGAGAWLVLDHLDTQGWDYPLLQAKSALALGLFPLAGIEAGLALAYFQGLDPRVSVSCCSSLFTAEAPTVTARVLALDPRVGLAGFAVAALVTLGLGALAWRRRGGWARAYAAASLGYLVVTLGAVVTTVAPYVYEQPHHHCPFCLVKPEYGGLGYFLYLPLLLGTILGASAALLPRVEATESLREAAPDLGRRLLGGALAGQLAVALVVAWAVLRSNLVLVGS